MSVKIIDCVIYNGDPILELRLEYLYEHVDRFVIIEACQTHSGKKKDTIHFYDQMEKFKKYGPKIDILILDTFPKMPENWIDTQLITHYITKGSEESWFREQYQRNYIKEHLDYTYSGNRKYIAMIADCDEIPRAETISILRNNYEKLSTFHKLEMDFFYYNFNWKKGKIWAFPFVLNDKAVKEATHTLSTMRLLDAPRVYSAGWHLSYFLDLQGIKTKLESFDHREYDNADFKSNEHIRKCILDGKDLFSRQFEDLIPNETSTLPDLFQEYNKLLLESQIN
jgi:beta-1,4-mannosyl-glycoprotein beta-1,4-N-acetylglucosaminyltransferase